MKQVLIKEGRAYAADITAPQPEKDMVLVRTEYSCISAGTEMAGLQYSGSSIVHKIIESPELIAMGLKMLKERGIKDTWAAAHGGNTLGTPMGYSASGVVEESGSGLFQKGDRVACMGVGYANHAGYIAAPVNLTVKIPDGVSFENASTAALGCIAMQGIRRADIELGEYVVISGLGILGQLASRFALAAGATVIATDIDNRRLEIAKKNGIQYVLNAKEDVVKEVNDITGGYGADKVIVTAATSSDELLSQSFKMCRRKGRVVLVGVAGMNLKREDMYRKELDFLISTSYGPGRYDSNYEEKGQDYPYGYVRFTEKRNLESYLRLLADGRLRIDDMIEKIYPAEESGEAYEVLKTGENRPLIVLLKYAEKDAASEENHVQPVSSFKKTEGAVRVALCGAGGFAKGMHIPNMKRMKDKYCLYAVQSRTGANAQALALENQAKYATTDYQKILDDPEVDMVMICTRHNLHADMVERALKAGKAVFVEKPMALTMEETDRIMKAARESGSPFMVGFNRRFSKYAGEIKARLKNRKNPILVSYRMNAGFIPQEHWTQTEEGGGRIKGEGCHIIDLFNYFTGSKASELSVTRLSPDTDHVRGGDNCVITVKYEDGSVCSLLYTGQGSGEYGKEYCEVYADGRVYVIDDYKSLKAYGGKVNEVKSMTPEKGQFEELEAFYDAIRNGDGYPIPLWQMEQATRLSIMAAE